MKKILLSLTVLAIIPLVLFAQGTTEVMSNAMTIFNVILPVIAYLASNLFKGWLSNGSKSMNWLVFAVTTICIGVAYGMLGFPKISLVELIGSTGAIWGFWTLVKEQILGKS